MVTFGSLSASVSSEDFRDFVTYWFNPGQLICIVALPANGKGRRLHQYATYEEITQEITDDVLYSMCYDDGGYNLYLAVNPVKEDKGMHRRGGKSNIAGIRGLYADIDVNKAGKTGVFSSEEEILDFLWSIDAVPSCIVQSGSGGLHCYWRVLGGMTMENGEVLQEQWWSYLNDKAGEVEIDRLIDTPRILRVPGSVRFPKEEEIEVGQVEMGEVRILHFEDGEYEESYLRDLSAKSFEVYSEEKKERQKELVVRTLQIEDELSSWSDLMILSEFEDRFNEEVSWDDILIPTGWTYIREDYEGRKEWARPGSGSKSAVTDWKDSPHVMSLLSSSPDTGLSDLKENDVALTKFRVALRLLYNDNDGHMFSAWRDLIAGEG